MKYCLLNCWETEINELLSYLCHCLTSKVCYKGLAYTLTNILLAPDLKENSSRRRVNIFEIAVREEGKEMIDQLDNLSSIFQREEGVRKIQGKKS